jgi:hypothetical protein
MVFEPLSSAFATPVTFVVLLTLLLAGVWYYAKKSHAISRYRQLWAMLAFFGLLISLGITAMNWYIGERIGDVAISETAFETPYGEIPFETVKEVVIYLDRKSSPFTGFKPGSETRRLLIIEKGGKTYSFSEDNYPIDEMIEPMRSKVEAINPN